MNNILSFNEYNGYELERVVYDDIMLNEKSSLNKGIRGFLNRRASRQVRSELSEEIEMSKTIMEGIKEGLETMSDNFDTIQKSIDNTDNEKKKGEKQKLLDDITKILENSKKQTWDINELIDDGEIDYTGFTANVGIASVAYFGILLTPFRAAIMIHKGYNYFFNIVKNTIRKALVMLQLNFDQFENLIVTQSLRSAGLITATDASSEIDQFYGNLTAQIAENKSLSKRQLEKFNVALKNAKDKFEQQRKSLKDQTAAETMYNNLDPYNNTYTKSLEALRQYSSDDVQKHLDAIKTSMNKLAGQEADLQTYSELIIAAAEEHAYAVSTSIYNKFAKMTEVFSLPNQQKLIDLILAANKEQKSAAKKAKKERDEQIDREKAQEKENGCVEIFKSIDGVELGEMDEETKRYDESEIKADKWTYDEFMNLERDDRETLESWLGSHREVLKKCDETLQLYIDTPFVNSSYIDSLIDYIGTCMVFAEETSETHILDFDNYKKIKLFEGDSKEEYELPSSEKKELDDKFYEIVNNYSDLIKTIYGCDIEKLGEIDITKEMEAKLAYIKSKCDEDKDKDILGRLETLEKSMDDGNKVYINLKSLDKHQIDDLKELYEDKELAIVGLKSIGKKVLKDGTFVKNSKNIVECINKCLDEKRVGLSRMTHILLANAITVLKDKRDHDYSTVEQSSEEDNTEKSEK